MNTATDRILSITTPDAVRSALITGIAAANGNGPARRRLAAARATAAAMRQLHGFAFKPAPIMTPPDANLKLEKGVVPSYGVTLQHFSFKSAFNGRRYNFCPNAGHCTKVCVLDNGNGRYNKVQRARAWKADLLLHCPTDFFVMLGHELQLAIKRHGTLLCRPNVNSDLQWERIAPALVDGSLFGHKVHFYGYTKLTDYLDGDGWVTPYYRVAYSWNEKSIRVEDEVQAFLERGGSVAMVTNRRKGHDVEQFDTVGHFTVVDADLTDEWIFQRGVIGDLSAKGSARKLIGKSAFVTLPYSVPVKIGR